MSTKRNRKKTVQKKKKAPNNKQLAVRIKKLEHQDELKYRDFYTSVDWTNNAVVIPCTNIFQGDDFNQRVGEEVIAKYLNIYFRNTKRNNELNAVSYRLLVFWDLQANAGPPAIFSGSVLTDQALIDDSVCLDQQLAPLNYRTKERYKVLLDKRFVVNPMGGSVSTEARVKSKSFNLGGAKIKYANSSGTTSPVTRALYVYPFSNQSSSDRLAVRFWFTDA